MVTIARSDPTIGLALSGGGCLPEAWKDGETSGLSIATALSVKAGKTLPWKTVRDVISGSINARFLEPTEDSQPWPCDFPSAQFVKFKATTGSKESRGAGGETSRVSGVLEANAELSPSQIQDLGDIVDKLTQIKAKTNTPLRFFVRVEVGDGKTKATPQVTKEINTLLKGVKDDLELK